MDPRRLLASLLPALGLGCSIAGRLPAPVPIVPVGSARPVSPDVARTGTTARASPAFDDSFRLTGLASEAGDEPAASRAMALDAEEDDEPGEDETESERPGAVRPAPSAGFLDGVRLSQADDSPGIPELRPGPRATAPRPRLADEDEDDEGKDQQDTNLDRPQAERRGGGGGPTRVKEEEDALPETDEDEFKSELLDRLLGLETSPLSVFGWVQGDFTGNPASPRDGTNFGVNPNFRANSWEFEQIYLVVERLARRGDEVDLGFRVDNLVGSDWSQYQMVGLFDNAFPPVGYGWDPVQFYGEVHLPIPGRDGVEIKAGRFFALPGYESAQAPARPLPSGSYMFGYSHPFTHFGVMSIWHVTDQVNLYNGAVNGWDRWVNQTYRWGYSGALSWDSKDRRTNLTITCNLGPNQFPRFFGRDYQEAPNGVTPPPFLAGRRNLSYPSNNALLFTTVLIHQWTERLTVVGETDQGFERDIPGLGPDGTNVNSSWYGLAGWFLYRFHEQVTGVWRAEVFRDNNGVRTGTAATYYETSLGAILKPRTWFWLRPEVRWDWDQGPPAYDDGRAHHQITLGFDAIFLF